MAVAPPPPYLAAQMRGKGPSIEDQVRNAYFSPSPHAYDPKQAETGGVKILGKISDAQVPSSIDYTSRESALLPGPGSYETPDLRDFALPEGGRLNRNPPLAKFKLDEYPIPAPGTYGVPKDPGVPRQLYGSFGKDPRITKFIQDEVIRSRSVPAPGEHEVMESMENLRPFCPEGGRYLDQGRHHGYFDTAAKLGEGGPDPTRYNLQGAIRPNKTAGKLVWKYKSESIDNTKRILTKVLGNPNENPAPGHYTLPDPQAIAPVPTLKGRDTALPMPHPYAYNCAPDHARKFDSFAPVREQNAGDQIFGRDFRRGTIGKDGRTTKAKASADEVAQSHLPVTMAERDIDQPGEIAQWKAGGFTSLRRAQSAPGMQRPRNPAMEQTVKNYPALSKFHGRRGGKTFMPMATKRPEIVNLSKHSEEFQSLHRRKWALGVIAAQIGSSTDAAMEPLDEQKLRDEAIYGLMDKAKFRMRMEGLAPDQQDLVLAELPGVLAENGADGVSANTSQQLGSGFPSPGISGRGSHAEPFAEPLPV